MNAVILAAGRGSRMGSLTDDAPKCMTKIHGKTLISWQIESLKKAGINTITVVTGYQEEILKAHLAKRAETLHNPIWDQTNMVGTLLVAEDIGKNEPLIVSYADIVYQPLWVSRLKNLSNPGALISVAYDEDWQELWSKRFTHPLDDAESFMINSNRQLTQIGQKTNDYNNIQGQYMGLVKINPSAWTLIRNAYQMNQKIDFTTLLNQLISQGHIVDGVKINAGWFEFDQASDLKLAEKELKNKNSPHLWYEVN